MDESHEMSSHPSLLSHVSQRSFSDGDELRFRSDSHGAQPVELHSMIPLQGPTAAVIADTNWFRWWLPEILASILSVIAMGSLIILLTVYDRRGLKDIDLPGSLTLNGLIALISELARVALMVPVGSAVSQEVWLWLSRMRTGSIRRGQVQDLDISDAASRGAWGSFMFLLKAPRRYLAHAIITNFGAEARVDGLLVVGRS